MEIKKEMMIGGIIVLGLIGWFGFWGIVDHFFDPDET